VSAAEPDCEFCHIARGAADAEVLAEGETWLAFFPLKPATPGHTLVIPRRHVRDFWEAEAQEAGELAAACLQVGRAVQQALMPQGMNLITSAGTAAEQTVFHLHLHVVPRWASDGFGTIWPPQGDLSDVDLEGVADRIRQALAHV
jgi:histidine triad (HIT) family protein